MKKQKVLITGGNRGIGLEATMRFLENDYEVVVVARDFSAFSLKDKTRCIEFDLANHESINQLIEEVGDVDILVNNAGIMHSLSADDYSDKKMLQILSINLISPAKLINQFSKYMVRKGKGRIVNTASIAGHIGHPDIWYGATKAGLINLTKSFSKMLGPKGIQVNAVAPGPVNTDMLSTIPKDRVETLKKNSFSGRVAEPGEIADTIYWLAVESPEYINGVTIDINSGAYLR